MNPDETPKESVEYWDREQGDTFEYLYRTDNEYVFSVNGGERTFECPTEFWHNGGPNWEIL